MPLPAVHSRSPAWVLAEAVSTALLSIASILLVGRVIGPDAMGAATMALAAFLMLDVISASVFTDALVQRPSMLPRHAGSAAGAGILAGLGTAGLLAALAPVLAGAAGAPEVQALTLALVPLLPISAWSGAMAGPLLRGQRFRLLALRALLGQPLGLAAALVLAREGFGPWAMIASQSVLTLTTFVLLLARGGPFPRLMLDRAALRELWPVAGPQIGAVAILVGRYRLFLLAVGMAAGQAVVALSHVAFRMLDGPLVVVFQTIGRIGLPRVCAAAPRGKAALAEAFGEIATLQALLGLPVCLGIALVAPQMVEAAMGPAWAEAAPAARIVALVSVLGFLLGDPFSLFTALGRTRVNLVFAIASLVMPLTLLALLRPGTPVGVAWCWSATPLLQPLALATMSLRALGRSPLWLLRRAAPALLAATAMVAAVLTLQAALPMRAGPGLLASATLGGVVYAAVAAAALGFRLPAALRTAPPATGLGEARPDGRAVATAA